MGEDEFRGIQIYDVIQDKKSNYLFATNEGLYYFDYFNFEKIECEESKSSSVFNFVINKDGVIYCHNLNNQIFEIFNKKCELFYELEANEVSADMSLAIADDDNLLIGVNKIIALNKSGKVINCFYLNNHYLGQPFRDSDKKTLYHVSSTDSVIIYHNGLFSVSKLFLNSKGDVIDNVFKFYKIKGKSYALNLTTKMHYIFNQATFRLTPLPFDQIFSRSQSVRLYETENEMWVAGTLPGVALINEKNKKNTDCIYYNNYFISDIYKDEEGNYLLSTFDKGVLVIPDLSMPDLSLSFNDDPVNVVYADSVVGLMFGSFKGKLMKYSNSRTFTVNNEGKRPIEGIYGSLESDLILFDDGHIRAYNKKTNKVLNILERSLKDAVFISNNIFYVGTNVGLARCDWDGKDKFNVSWLKNLNRRTYHVEYCKNNKSIYASTSSGLYLIDSTETITKLKYNNRDIYPNQLLNYKNRIWCLNNNNLILIIEDNNVIDSIRLDLNQNQKKIIKIKIHNNSIVAKSSFGLYQFDMNGKLIYSMNYLLGVFSKRIIDFSFYQNKMWLSHSGGIQELDLNRLIYKKEITPLIRFDKILVNNKEYLPSSHNTFNYKQKNIQFVFSSPTLRNREAIRYHYRLNGHDDEWHTLSYPVHQVNYSALSHGAYIMQVKAEVNGVFSNTESFIFTVESPIYAKWWFISLIVILFLTIVYLFYKRQLKYHQKKLQQINELNASRLTAIQSQMNPHFIFNSLNSIQDLILKGDVEKSYSYITTFSNMVRKTLSYSDKDFIDFEKEIQLLELYLSLEQLRFKKEFKYFINTNNIVDVKIPPMIIQPFIENALVHGLLHKSGEKRLCINFELNDTLICTIEDNGIGRERAKEIKERQRLDHESFSVKATRKRFDILSEVFTGQFGFSYEDLKNENEVLGTRVTLVLPVKYKF